MSIQIDLSAAPSAGEPLMLDLPFDHRRGTGQSEQKEFQFNLTPDLTRRLASLSEQENVPLASVYLANYCILLSRYANTPDLTIDFQSGSLRDPRLPGLLNDGEIQAVLRIHCPPDLSMRVYLRTVGSSVANNEQYSREERVAYLGEAAFCHSGFIWEEVGCGDFSEAPKVLSPVQSNFDISFYVESSREAARLMLLYRSDLFEPSTIERMSRHLTCLFEETVNSLDVSVAELDMMHAEERALVLGAYAGSSTDYPQACLHQLFAEHAQLHPDAEAVVFGNDRLTYRQLDRRSNQVAQFLVNEGIRPEDRVGIFMDRSADMIVSMLGILKAGGAYVPIDPDYPAERLAFIAEDTGVRWVLTQRSVTAVLPAAAPSIYVDTPDSPISRHSDEPVVNRSTPESVAVVIYTSGSTGKPKAACIPHRAAVRTVRDTNYIRLTPDDRITQAGSPSFDAAILEIWLALANGNTLVGIRKETLLDGAELRRTLQNERISILVLNTSYVHQIGRDTPEVLKGIRKVLFGGEAAEPGPLRELLRHVGPGVLVNGYGPAEGCVITTCHEISEIPEDATAVSIGRPVSNAQVYLLNSLQRPVSIGEQGEIYIGGEGVARGYLNRPELTRERFVPDVFSGKPGRLLYRTGDLARMRGNGELEFRGRADEQVKIRGHRIELAEVREAITAHPEVKQVFLMVREDQPGDKRLIAYVTLRRPFSAAQELLRQHAKEKLPAHMRPAAFVVVDSIPLNTNGKIDRKALPAPTERPDFERNYQAPGNEIEHKLVKVWQELLRLNHIGVNDNFFDLGGHSLLAARLVARIEKEIGDNIPVATLFEAPTIAELATRLNQRTYATAWSPLVELHASEQNTTAAPFFCVHSLGANLVSFHKIASFLRGDRPIYGVQPHGLDGQQEPLESIEGMASAYLEEIRKKQPYGPYYLGGVCLGGIVAYEMAQQLRAAGEEVQFLALIDSFLPGELQHLHARPALTYYLDWHIGEMLLLPGLARLNYVVRWLANGGVRLGRALGWSDQSSLARVTRKIAEAHQRAVLAYKPKPYGGKIVQLLCGDASYRAYEDRRLAWSSLVSGGFEVRIVPGNHLTMVEEPNAQVLARELQTCLDRANSNADSDIRIKENRCIAKNHWQAA